MQLASMRIENLDPTAEVSFELAPRICMYQYEVKTEPEPAFFQTLCIVCLLPGLITGVLRTTPAMRLNTVHNASIIVGYGEMLR